jgi:hypothetical protein
VKFKLEISKKIVLRLLVFVALTGTAVLFDFYFENHPQALDEFQPEKGKTENEHGAIYLFSQTATFNAKSPAQKSPGRKVFDEAHDKFLQKCHQLRNHMAFKAETGIIRKPLFLSYHHLIFRQYHFSLPGEDPLIS